MQRLSAEVILMWGSGDEYLFALKGKQIEQLEFDHKKGIGILAQEILTHQCGRALIRDVIQLGLEGGGMHPIEAKKLMTRYFEGVPLATPQDPTAPLSMAYAIMGAAWIGVPDLKGDGGEEKAGKSEPSYDMAMIRGKLLEFGVSPEYAERHSMYEMLSMLSALSTKGQLSDEDFDEMRRLVAERKERMGLR